MSETESYLFKLHHQRWFIQDVYRQGWTGFDPGGPSDKDLDTAYDQYNDFLERSITVERRDPEWKDDLIWHTHQLMPDRYRCVYAIPDVQSKSWLIHDAVPMLQVIFKSSLTTSPVERAPMDTVRISLS